MTTPPHRNCRQTDIMEIGVAQNPMNKHATVSDNNLPIVTMYVIKAVYVI